MSQVTFKALKQVRGCRPVTIPMGAYVECLGVDGGTYVVRDLNTNEVLEVSKKEFNVLFERVW